MEDSDLIGCGLFLLCLVAWCTHVIVCIKMTAWVFLLAGAIFFPIGVVHEVGLWFGVF